MSITTTAETVDQAAPTVRRLLQRQILPIDRDTDVFALYVDPEEARLDADRYEIGGDRAAKDLNNAAIRQSTSTGRAVHPDQILSRTAFRVRQGSKMSFFRTSDYQLDFDIALEGSPFVSRFSPDGKSIYNMGNAPRGATPAGIRVWKADVASKKVVATSSVSVLDPDTLKVVKQFPTPMTPDGLFFGRVR